MTFTFVSNRWTVGTGQALDNSSLTGHSALLLTRMAGTLPIGLKWELDSEHGASNSSVPGEGRFCINSLMATSRACGSSVWSAFDGEMAVKAGTFCIYNKAGWWTILPGMGNCTYWNRMFACSQIGQRASEQSAEASLHFFDQLLAFPFVHQDVDAQERLDNAIFINLQKPERFQVDEVAVPRLEPITRVAFALAFVIHCNTRRKSG